MSYFFIINVFLILTSILFAYFLCFIIVIILKKIYFEYFESNGMNICEVTSFWIMKNLYLSLYDFTGSLCLIIKMKYSLIHSLLFSMVSILYWLYVFICVLYWGFFDLYEFFLDICFDSFFAVFSFLYSIYFNINYFFNRLPSITLYISMLLIYSVNNPIFFIKCLWSSLLKWKLFFYIWYFLKNYILLNIIKIIWNFFTQPFVEINNLIWLLYCILLNFLKCLILSIKLKLISFFFKLLYWPKKVFDIFYVTDDNFFVLASFICIMFYIYYNSIFLYKSLLLFIFLIYCFGFVVYFSMNNFIGFLIIVEMMTITYINIVIFTFSNYYNFQKSDEKKIMVITAIFFSQLFQKFRLNYFNSDSFIFNYYAFFDFINLNDFVGMFLYLYNDNVFFLIFFGFSFCIISKFFIWVLTEFCLSKLKSIFSIKRLFNSFFSYNNVNFYEKNYFWEKHFVNVNSIFR